MSHICDTVIGHGDGCHKYVTCATSVIRDGCHKFAKLLRQLCSKILTVANILIAIIVVR